MEYDSINVRSILRGGSGQDREANGLGQVITLVHVYWIKGTSNQRKDVHKRYMVAERLLELSELLFFPESGFNARRFKSDLPIQVNCRGRMQTNATLADISEGGAWIRGVPELDIGETGFMTLQGLDQNLPFTVRSQSPEAIHVEFDLGHRREAYERWFDAHLRKQAA